MPPMPCDCRRSRISDLIRALVISLYPELIRFVSKPGICPRLSWILLHGVCLVCLLWALAQAGEQFPSDGGEWSIQHSSHGLNAVILLLHACQCHTVLMRMLVIVWLGGAFLLTLQVGKCLTHFTFESGPADGPNIENAPMSFVAIGHSFLKCQK